MSLEYLRSNPLAEHNSGIALSSKELPPQNSGTGNMYPGQAGRAFVQGGGGMSQYYSSDVGNPENAYANGSYAPVTVGYNSVTQGGRRRGSRSKRKLRRNRKTKRKVARYSRRHNKKHRIPVPRMTGGVGGGVGGGAGGGDFDDAGSSGAALGGISSRLGNLQLQGNRAGGGCDCGANSAGGAAAAAAASAAADTAEAAAASARAAAAAVLAPENQMIDEANLPAEFGNPVAFNCVDCVNPVMYDSPQFDGRVDLPNGEYRCGDCVRREAEAAAAPALEEDDQMMGDDLDEEVAFYCADCGQPVIVGSREDGGRREINGVMYCGDCAPNHLDDEEGMSDGSSSYRTDSGTAGAGTPRRAYSPSGMSDGSYDGMYGGSISSRKNTRSTHFKNKRKNPKSRLTKKLKMKSSKQRK